MTPSAPRPRGLLTQRLLALFAAGWALFGFPLLGLALGEDAGGTLAGLPRAPLLIFAAWALVIACLALLLERAGDDD